MIQQIQQELKDAVGELLDVAKLQEGDIFVIGCSTSEILGEHIGKGTSIEIGETVIRTIREILSQHKIYLAVQCCEHVNRAIVVERKAAEKYHLEEVNVIPQLNAGGGAATAAYRLFEDPAVVEHIVAKAGLDIGDTSIGMHIKYVQVPVRLKTGSIGQAHLTALRSRLKLIGGDRAVYKK
ncbi:MAG: TIGR01440 family protein [Peptostreptococcaceae bacterium]|nr:TIGR01440 family protein [Peptostreptococcaceae bacterium]